MLPRVLRTHLRNVREDQLPVVQPPLPIEFHPADRPKQRRPRRIGTTRPKARAKAKSWVPAGKRVRVQGRNLPNGMLYVGSSLAGVSPYASTEPALIDPRLAVDNGFPDVDGREMGYWPSYSEISPSSRAAYLDWLAAGRPGGAHIGYVFLFFYGIERRILFDIGEMRRGDEEVQTLVAEVTRLLSLYRHNRSFNRYASEFLALVRFLAPDFDYKDLDPPRAKPGWDLPFDLKIGLGSIVASGDPLPASWALSWLRLIRIPRLERQLGGANENSMNYSRFDITKLSDLD